MVLSISKGHKIDHMTLTWYHIFISILGNFYMLVLKIKLIEDWQKLFLDQNLRSYFRTPLL